MATKLKSTETVIRMGPITVLALLIVIALATLGILSLTTARASLVAAEKQDVAIQALYANEVEAQSFLSELDSALAPHRNAKPNRAAAMADIAQSGRLGDAIISDATVEKTFENESRALKVIVVVREDLNLQVVSWKTESRIDTSESVELWQGNEA